MRLDKALAAFLKVEKGPIGSHSTETSSKGWDGPANEARLGNDDSSAFRRAFAWFKGDGDRENKTDYSFIHHEVSSDGSVGAANIQACRTGIGILNGGRGTNPSSAQWGDDRQGIYNHLAKHIRDADMEPPELKERVVSAPEPFSIIKQDDGQYRWIGFSATAFKDKTGEIISTRALERAVDHFDETGEYGPLLLWHVEDASIGEADFSAVEGRILIESGTIEPAVAERLLAYEEPLGMSVGAWVASDKGNEVYDWAFVFERSVVPLDAAANPYTAFSLTEENMDTRKFSFLSKILGEDEAQQLVATAKATSATLEGSGVAYKSLEDPETVIRDAVQNTPEETRSLVEAAMKSLKGEEDASQYLNNDGAIDATSKAAPPADPPAPDPPAPPDQGDQTDQSQAGNDQSSGDNDQSQASAGLDEETESRIAAIEQQVQAQTQGIEEIKGSIGELATVLKDIGGGPKISKAFANRPSQSDDTVMDNVPDSVQTAMKGDDDPVAAYVNDIFKVGSQ